MAILVGGLLSIGAANWIAAEFERNIIVGSLSAAVIAAGVGGIGYWLTTEIISLKRLRAVEEHRIVPEEIGGLPTSQVEERIAEIVEALRALGVEQAMAAFRDAVQPHHSSVQRLELLSGIVLRPLDQRAETAIRRAVISMMGVSAVVPSALGDALIFGFRGLRLIRNIAEIYGHRPGAAGTLHLFKRLLLGTGTVGSADLVGNTVGGLVAQHLSGAMMEKVGEKIGTAAAESALAGQRMARIGLFAMRACRPIALARNEEPSIAKLVMG